MLLAADMVGNGRAATGTNHLAAFIWFLHRRFFREPLVQIRLQLRLHFQSTVHHPVAIQQDLPLSLSLSLSFSFVSLVQALPLPAPSVERLQSSPGIFKNPGLNVAIQIQFPATGTRLPDGRFWQSSFFFKLIKFFFSVFFVCLRPFRHARNDASLVRI